MNVEKGAQVMTPGLGYAYESHLESKSCQEL